MLKDFSDYNLNALASAVKLSPFDEGLPKLLFSLCQKASLTQMLEKDRMDVSTQFLMPIIKNYTAEVLQPNPLY